MIRRFLQLAVIAFVTLAVGASGPAFAADVAPAVTPPGLVGEYYAPACVAAPPMVLVLGPGRVVQVQCQ